MDERFKVEIHVTLSKDTPSGYSRPSESVSYTEAFEIRAIGWAEVAKILANLNRSVGSIRAKYPVEPAGY